MHGQVIVLNGVSSSGKTTLAKAIQKYGEDIWLYVAMDTFMSMLPDGREFDRDWFPVIEVEIDGETFPQIGNGPRGDALLVRMRELVGRLAESGFNVAVDDVADAPAIADYRRRLGSACFVVKVDAPLSELERREHERGDRLIGLAREQSTRIHEGISYDLDVDTHKDTLDALARKVLGAASA